MKTKISIYSSSLEKAIDKAREIVRESGEKVITEKIKSFYNNEIETDSMLIRIFKGTESSRGMRSSIAYIDKDISKEIVNEVILPTLITISTSSDGKVMRFDYFRNRNIFS